MAKASARPASVPARLLIVDDDEDTGRALGELFDAAMITAEAVRSAEQAVERFKETTYAVVLCDLQLPGESGLELVKRLRREAPNTAVVVMTGHASVATAVSALKLGAVDYLVKPVNAAQLRKLVEKLTRERPFYMPNAMLTKERDDEEVFEGMLSRSPKMRKVFERIELVAPTDATVLLVGETGTGKELAARALHARSARAQGPFVPVHTGALPKELIESELFGHEKGSFTGAVAASEGRFGAAQGGTIFLDEISTMPDRAQVDLLRVLETFKYTRVGGKTEHTADVRVVCATNRDLMQMVADGKFREDVYYRMAIFPIHLPPLRERPEDIGLLAERFMRVAAERYKRNLRGLPAETASVLEEYEWPGNVRELRNVTEQAVLMARGEVISPEEMRLILSERPKRVPSVVVPIAVGTQLDEVAKTLARRTLEVFRGNRQAAAEALGVDIDRLDHLLSLGANPT